MMLIDYEVSYQNLAAEMQKQKVTATELFYLRSCLRSLEEFRELICSDEMHQYGLGDDVLSDNIDGLDCFIDRITRGLRK